MDTVTLVRSAIRGLLAACDSELEQQLRAVLARDDDYRSAGKPVCDWDDRTAREALIDALASDALALLVALEGVNLEPEVGQAATLLAAVVGQDLDAGEDGVFVIARRVAKDRIISTVDPDARHGHKTAARGFDGFKGHVAIDPDSELILATVVTAGNAGDAAAVDELLADDLHPASQPQAEQPQPEQSEAEQSEAEQSQPEAEQTEGERPTAGQPGGGQEHAGEAEAQQPEAGQAAGASGPLSVYGDSCLWRRRGARHTRAGGRGDLHQDPAADRARSAVCQKQVHDRPRRRDSDLPGRAHRRADRQRAQTGREVRRPVRWLSAG